MVVKNNGGLAINGALNRNAMSPSMYGGGSLSVGGTQTPSKPVLPPTQGGVISLGGGSATDQQFGTHKGMFPSTPVASITNNADGSTKHTFAKPDTGKTGTSETGGTSTGTTPGVLPTTSADQYSRQTGQPNPGYINPNTPPTPPPVPPTPPAPDSSNPYASELGKYNTTAAKLADLQAKQATRTAGINNSGKGLPWATGTENQLNIATAGQEQALAGQLGAESGMLSNLKPITGVPYGTQTINPATGQPYASTGSTGTGGVNVDPNNPVASIPSIADAVINGRMTIDQANSALGNNIGMTTNLRSQIMAKNPNFNFTQSSASAATQAVGQQVNTFATSANSALDKLTSDFGNLPDWQKMGIPGIIGIEQALGQFFGNDKLSTYQTTLHDARAQLSGVLATAGGMTPTSAGDTAQTYLPDNMTKDQLPAKIAAAKALVAQKVQAFQQSGAQTGTSSNSGGTSGGVTFGWNG